MEDAYRIIDCYLMIRLPEEIDHASCTEISRRADHMLLDNRVSHVVFDFSDTRFMDSSGVGVLAGRYKKISCFGGKVYAIHADSRIRKILRMSGLEKIVEIMDQEGQDDKSYERGI
ncbi:MAG: anti-sigma factor antagonist [Eubacteriales bacterium]|nr:anti-sigma factor antagonist [Eubacteriales bacterium]